MASVRDPYRVLGLARGASLDEVKRAYRRLAKEHHPDSAGERALPRFLEIQAAYEQLVGPNGGGAGRTAGGRPRPPWQAEDTRADATHRAYGARTRGASARGARSAGGARRSTGQRSDGQSTEHPRGRQRPPNKATPGSTTYDGADDQPFEPDWTGASWYGTSSGTYWTLNPREYADPRKHGPEYQARARRAREEARQQEAVDDPGRAAGPEADSPVDAHVPPRADPAPGDTRPSSTWWSARGRGARATAETGAAPNDPARGVGPPPPFDGAFGADAAPPPDPFALLGALERALIDAPRRSVAARLGYAAIGGVPVVLGLAWALGELTGCGRFAATCEPAAISAAWIGGLAIVGLLLLAPSAASIAAVGTVALVLAAIPATIFLSATGGSRQPEASGAALGLVLAVAWVAGVAYAVGRRRRAGARRGPVS